MSGHVGASGGDLKIFSGVRVGRHLCTQRRSPPMSYVPRTVMLFHSRIFLEVDSRVGRRVAPMAS